MISRIIQNSAPDIDFKSLATPQPPPPTAAAAADSKTASTDSKTDSKPPAAAGGGAASSAASRDVAYYSFCPYPGFRVIALDSYDLNLLAKGDSPEKTRAAEKMMNAGKEAYHVSMNGGVGPVQLDWFTKQLAAAVAANERVWIVTHCPLVPECAYGPRDAVLWNCVEVMKVVYDTVPKGVVIGCLYGHEHSTSSGTVSFLLEV